jgi:hypothetical protein
MERLAQKSKAKSKGKGQKPKASDWSTPAPGLPFTFAF